MPRAAIASTRHQRDAACNAWVTAAGTCPLELTATSTAKPTRKAGRSGGRGPAASPWVRARKSSEMQNTAGSSIATRNSLTMVAVSPASGETL